MSHGGQKRDVIQVGNIRVPFNFCPECGAAFNWVSAKPTLLEVEDSIVDIVCAITWCPQPDGVPRDSDLVEEVGLDELDSVELLMAVEDKFNIDFNDQYDHHGVLTIRTLAKSVVDKQSGIINDHEGTSATNEDVVEST